MTLVRVRDATGDCSFSGSGVALIGVAAAGFIVIVLFSSVVSVGGFHGDFAGVVALVLT